MTLYVILVAGLALWMGALWRRGFFGPETPAIERKVYLLRIGIWFVSMWLVTVPLRQHRDQLGTAAYLVLTFAILALFYWLGLVASRALMKRAEEVDR